MHCKYHIILTGGSDWQYPPTLLQVPAGLAASNAKTLDVQAVSVVHNPNMLGILAV